MSKVTIISTELFIASSERFILSSGGTVLGITPSLDDTLPFAPAPLVPVFLYDFSPLRSIYEIH